MKKLDCILGSFPNSQSNIWFRGVIWSYPHVFHSVATFIQKGLNDQAVKAFQQLLKKNGTSFLKEIDGAFHLALWDEETKSGFLYKSLLCKISLYYRKTKNEIHWSTDPTHLLDHSQSLIKQVDTDQILWTCLGDTVSPNSSHYKGISRLPAGYGLYYQNGNVEIKKLDALTFRPLSKRHCNMLELSAQARDIIDSTVQRRFNHDDKVGVILSGGVDSSAILTGLHYLGIPVVGYHWSFSNIPSADETNYARILTNRLKVPLIEIDTNKMNLEGTYIKENWPFLSPYNHSFYALYEQVKDQCKDMGISILGSGYLGDTLFGPEFHPVIILRDVFRSLPFRQALRYTREALGCVLGKQENEIHPRISWYEEYLTDTALDRLRNKNGNEENMDNGTRLARFSDNECESVLEYQLFEKEGIHFNHIFANKELMEFSLSLPAPMKMIPAGGQWIEKPLLRLAFLNQMPREIVARNHRQIMSAWNETYLVNNKKQILRILDEDSWLVELGVIDIERLGILAEDDKRLARVAPGLVCCIMTELWLKNLPLLKEGVKIEEVSIVE